jgi:PAS domain S-box-containing protein
VASEDAAQLHGCLNELVGRITAACGDPTPGEPTRIANALLDGVAALLPLSFAFVRVHDPADGSAIESERGTAQRASTFASTRIGTYGDVGILLVASDNPAFPTETDRLILELAANQAAMALQAIALRKARQDSRSIIDDIPGLVALLSATGEVEFANRRLIEYTGQTLQELQRWTTSDVVHPDDFGHTADVFGRSIAFGIPYEILHRIRRADGVYRWCQDSGLPIRDTTGQIVGWCVLLIDVDERKRAEEALATRERNLQLIIDAIPAVAWSARTDGGAEFFNQHYLDFVGLSLEQAKDWGWTVAVHPDDVDRLAAIWRRVLASEQSGEAEARFRRHDGEYRWFLIRAEPLRNETGRTVQWYGVNTDIEDRKRAEEELRRSEAFLAQAQRLTQTGSLWWDVSTGEITWSDETYRLMGYARTIKPTIELILNRVHPDDLQLVGTMIARSAREGANLDFEHRLVMEDGSVKHIHVVLQNVGVHSGEPRFVGAATDITERKRAADELHRAYHHLTEAQRLSQTGSFTWDVEQDEHYWSEEFYRICEFERGSSVSIQRLGQIVHREDVPLYEDAIGRATAGTDAEFEFRIVTARGAVKHLRGFAHRIAERSVFVGAVQDVTTGRIARQALNRLSAELTRVSKVTTLSALTASIAHEINQPLQGILMNAGTCRRMLDATPPNIEGGRETAKRALRDANRASEVVARLRALFSKREASLEVFDLNDAMREVIALSSNELQRNGIVLQSELANDLPTVTGDRIQLQQVMLNLVRNASDAMVGIIGRPRQLLVKTELEDGSRVRVTVRDCGVGVSLEQTDSLFEAFHTTKIGGMGIGLFVSRSIIERHQGRLWAEPNDGPGATFAFSIPLTIS